MASSGDNAVATARTSTPSAASLKRLTGGGRRRVPLLGVFAVPGSVVYGALVLVPMILSFYYSLTNRSLIYPDTSFVGLANYTRLLSDPDFLSTLGFTAVLTGSLVVGVNVVGLALALLLNRVGRLFFSLRMIFFLPVALSGVIVAFLWSTILTDNGTLNTVLDSVGLHAFTNSWLGTAGTAQLSVIAVAGWQALGLCIVVYLAGLQTVSDELKQAARTDGCGTISVFRYVTWPLLAPAVTINTVLLLINGFKTYEIPVVLNGTGPAGATRTLSTEVIRVGFNLNRAGLASAMAVVMLILVGAVAGLAMLLLQRREVAA